MSRVAENIYLIDTQAYSIADFTAVYLLAEEKMALIDAGPSSSAQVVLQGIRQLGFDPQDIAYIIVTHVHLDHSGGAWLLLKEMPQARVVVHEKGARHLIDPSRLVNSTVEFMGQRVMEQHGEVEPIEPSRVQPAKDGEVIELSPGQRLKIIYAPGHAPHEVCIYEERNRGLFTGDALGMHFPEEGVLLPLHPPPDFDLSLCLDTCERLLELPAEVLFFTHFGATGKAKEILQLSRSRLESWSEMLSQAMEEDNLKEAIEELKASLLGEVEALRGKRALYEFVKNQIPLGVETIKHYLERAHHK